MLRLLFKDNYNGSLTYSQNGTMLTCVLFNKLCYFKSTDIIAVTWSETKPIHGVLYAYC